MSSLTIYDILAQVRRKPGVYLSQINPCSLLSFLNGYALASPAELLSEADPAFAEFHDWVANKLSYPESMMGWANMIEGAYPDEITAFLAVFELLDEYRGVQQEVLSRVLVPEDARIDTSWKGYASVIRVGRQFEAMPKPAPGFLSIRQLHSDNTWIQLAVEDQSGNLVDAWNGDSVEQAKERASLIFGIAPSDWP